MTNPAPSRAFASSVDSLLRDYIDARIHEELKPLLDDMVALRGALLATRESLQRDMGNVAGRIANAEDLIGMSSKRVADLASLAKKMNEEG